MRLETGGSIHSSQISEEDLINTFKNDQGRGDFIILSHGKEVYIQAAGEDDGLFHMEYREGDEEHHFQCTEKLTKEQVQETFLKYLEGDSSWKVDHHWAPNNEVKRLKKPWWKFW